MKEYQLSVARQHLVDAKNKKDYEAHIKHSMLIEDRLALGPLRNKYENHNYH